MGLQISLDTETLTRGDAVTLAKLLESVSPGALLEALGEGHGDVITVVSGPGPMVVGDTITFPAPDAPTGAVPIPPAPPSGVDSATPPATVAAPAVDSTGLPWDVRIHAGNRAQNGDGTWRKKKAVHEDTVRLVEAELRANLAAPPAMPAAPEPGEPAAPPPPPAPVPAAPTLSGPQLFARYMERATAAQTAGQITTADVAAIATGLGLVGTAGLLTRPDLIPQAEAALAARLATV
jgi:hypothetical protein